jgi:hypothetical protein
MLNEDDLFNKEATAMDSAIKMAKKASQAANKSVKSITKIKTKTPKKTQKQRRTKKEKKEAETMEQEDKKMKQKPAKKTRAKKGEPKKPRKKYKDPRVSKRNRTTKPLPPLITGEYAKYIEAVKIRNIRLDKLPDQTYFRQKLVKSYGKKANNWKNLNIYAARFKSIEAWRDANNYLELMDDTGDEYKNEFKVVVDPEEEDLEEDIIAIPTKKIFIRTLYNTSDDQLGIYTDLYTVRTLKYNCGTMGAMGINELFDNFYLKYVRAAGDDVVDEIPLAGGFLGLEYIDNGKPHELQKKEGRYDQDMLLNSGVRQKPLPHPCLIVVNPEYNKVLIKFRMWDQISKDQGIETIKEILDTYNYFVDDDNYDVIDSDILSYYDIVYNKKKIGNTYDEIKEDLVYFSDEED